MAASVEPLRLSVGEPRPVALAAHVARAARPRGTVVVVHGFTSSKASFDELLPLLADAGWDALAYDQRGHVDSEHRGPYDLDTLAADLVGVARLAGDRLAAPVHVLGHSYGGLVAQRAVATAPGAFASLLLLCTGPGGLAVVAPERQPATLERAELFRDAVAQRDLAGLWAERVRVEALDESLPHTVAMRDRFLATDREALAQTDLDLLRAGDLVPATAASRVPVRWAYGADDTAWDRELQRESAARLGVVADVIPDAAHSPARENPAATAAWVLDAVAGS